MSKAKTKLTKRRVTKKGRPAGSQFKGRVFDPVCLVIQETTSGIQLLVDGHPILLPNGSILVHPRRTLIEHIREEFSGFGTVTIDSSGRVLKPDMISADSLLGVQRSMEADLNHPFVTGFGDRKSVV